MKTCTLDLDDFSENNNRLDWLWVLKNEFPHFKVSLFTVPKKCSESFLIYIMKIEWIQLCLHGLKHIHNEEINNKDLKTLTEVFVKVYRAPYWQLSDEMYKRLKKLKYKIMIHPDDPRDGIKYNWNIKDSPPPLNILRGHGHIQDTQGNGLVEAFENIIKLHKDTIFKFI